MVATSLWLYSSDRRIRAISAFIPALSTTFLPNVFRRLWVLKWSIFSLYFCFISLILDAINRITPAQKAWFYVICNLKWLEAFGYMVGKCRVNSNHPCFSNEGNECSSRSWLWAAGWRICQLRCPVLRKDICKPEDKERYIPDTSELLSERLYFLMT